MKFIITGRKIDVTEGMKERIYKRLGKLEKYFKEEPEVKVTIRTVKDDQIIEATIYDNGVMYRAEERDADLYTAIDKIVDIIERQLRKHKTHLEKKLKKGAFDLPYEGVTPIDEENDLKVVKVKRFAFKPMHAEEAILQMELLGHNFFVFDNAEDNAISIVYKRKDGKYALIEQEK